MRLRRLFRLTVIIVAACVVVPAVLAAVYAVQMGPDPALDRAEQSWYGLRYRLELARSSSRPARWWRCLGDGAPNLVELAGSAGSDPVVRFSWTSGYGGGDVYITVHGSGEATARIERHGVDEPEIYRATIPRDDLLGLLRTIDATGLFCQRTDDRVGYLVLDLGRFEIAAEGPGFSRRVFVDDSHTLPDTAAFEEVVDAFYALDRVFGVELQLGPFGTTTVAID